MTASITDHVCTECGLCCDGTLMADVETYGDKDAELAEDLGLETDYDNDKGSLVISLPCSALQGTRCSAYPHRPITCGSFECGLLQATRRNLFSMEEALDIIGDTRKKVVKITEILSSFAEDDTSLPLKERIMEALQTRPSPELSAASRELARMIGEYFLTTGKRE